MAKKRVVSSSRRVDRDKVGQTRAAGTERAYAGTREAQWTCNSCGRAGIPGSVKKCPACQHPKDESETYEEAVGGAYLTEAELAARGVDPDQHLSDESCAFCGSRVKPGTQICPNCHAVIADVGYATRVCPSCGRESSADSCPSCGAATRPKGEPAAAPAPPPPPQKRNPWPLLAAGAVMLLLAFLLLRPRAVTASVSGVSWERHVTVEESQYVRQEGWSLPPGADLVSSEERQSGTEQVLIGYQEACRFEDRQSGTEEQCSAERVCETVSVYDYTETQCYDDGTCDDFDVYRDEQQCRDETVCRDVPVYESVEICEDAPVYDQQPVFASWYVYDAWEWVAIDTLTANGTSATLRWPDLNLSADQREAPGSREERCTVHFRLEDDETADYDVPCDSLAAYAEGSEWEIQRRGDRVTEAVRP